MGTGFSALLTVIALLLAGCSGDEEEPAPAPGSAVSSPDVRVVTESAIGRVRGRLDPARRAEVVRGVTAVVDGWSDRGYGGDYPRTSFDGAFAAFTPDARALARRRTSLLSNAAIGGDLEAVTIARRVVQVDVLAPKGRLAGATARIRIVLELEGATDRREIVSGRLLLTPSAEGWRVFGFDVSRGRES
ncbi:MAG TPA: hypothetical protein VNS46_11005 [Nocardioides sp.]|nr:hypothetical protein [Nocardioides sp.]